MTLIRDQSVKKPTCLRLIAIQFFFCPVTGKYKFISIQVQIPVMDVQVKLAVDAFAKMASFTI